MDSKNDNHDAVNDVIRLSKWCKRSDIQWVQFRKIVEDEGTDPSYRRMLGIILGKADKHLDRESDDNVISTDGSGGISNGGGGLRVKCEAGASGSKPKPKRLLVEKSESPLDKNCRGSNLQGLRISEPDRIITNRLLRGKHNSGIDQVKKSWVQNCGKLKRKRAAKDLLERNAKVESSRKILKHREIRNSKAESTDETDDDVAILEDNGFLENLRSSFVSSKRFHNSMEEDADFRHLGRSCSSKSASDGFRKEVLDVLGQPFHMDELKRLRDVVRNGSYFNYYPDLESKLKRWRYKRGKCLNILRGFFFWLQNVCREGAFKPWKDGQCLAVEPASP